MCFCIWKQQLAFNTKATFNTNTSTDDKNIKIFIPVAPS